MISGRRQSNAEPAELYQLNRNAAGIDVGATSHFTAPGTTHHRVILRADHTNHLIANTVGTNHRVRVHNSVDILRQDARATMSADQDDDLWLIPRTEGIAMDMHFWIVTCETGRGSIKFVEFAHRPGTVYPDTR